MAEYRSIITLSNFCGRLKSYNITNEAMTSEMYISAVSYSLPNGETISILEVIFVHSLDKNNATFAYLTLKVLC